MEEKIYIRTRSNIFNIVFFLLLQLGFGIMRDYYNAKKRGRNGRDYYNYNVKKRTGLHLFNGGGGLSLESY